MRLTVSWRPRWAMFRGKIQMRTPVSLLAWQFPLMRRWTVKFNHQLSNLRLLVIYTSLTLVPGWIWIASSWESRGRSSTSCSTGVGSQVWKTFYISNSTSDSHRVEDDSESECGDLVGQLALPGILPSTTLVSHLSQKSFLSLKFHLLGFSYGSKTGVGDSSEEEDSLDLEP